MNETQPASQFYGVLIRFERTTWLLPSVLLADVLPWQKLHPTSIRDACFGAVDWNGTTLPVWDPESALGDPVGCVEDERTRIAVLHALRPDVPGGAWALRCVGYPRMVPIEARVLSVAASPQQGRHIWTRLQIGAREVDIPDLAVVEAEMVLKMARHPNDPPIR